MRRVLWILGAATLAVALAWWLAALPGRVSASAAGYTVEIAAPLALVGGALGLALLLLGLRLLGGLLGLPRWLGGRRREGRRRAGEAAVGRALVALAAGEAAEARRQAQRARRDLGETAQTLLLAAEAARLAGSHGQAEALYQTMAERADCAFLGLRGLFRQAVERGEWREAAALARRAEALQPGGNWLREARLRLAAETGEWGRALALAGPDLPEEVVATAAAQAEADPETAAGHARRAWKANPTFAPAVLAHAAALRREGREGRAEEVVLAAWKAAPQPELADFLMDDAADARARLKVGIALSNAHADHVETQLLLGRLSLEARELRDARFHAERACGLAPPTRRVHLLLADIAAAEGRDPAPALRAAAQAPADPAWHCGRCGAVQPRWVPLCPACQAAGRSGWGAPAGGLRLLGTP